jgi:hypothetical protein
MSAYMIPNLLRYFLFSALIASLLSKIKIQIMNGNRIQTSRPTTEIAKEIVSATEDVVKAHTLSKAPKSISRYPSVKNLKKLLKKYEFMIF